MCERLRNTLLLIIATGISAACGRPEPRPQTPAAVSAPAAGVYSGIFPCDGCPGIATTVWLRPDGRFFLRQAYSGSAGEADARVFGLGRWRWEASEAELVLSGAGPERRFERRGPSALALLTVSPQAHLLSHDPDAAEFGDPLRLKGMTRLDDGRATLTECLTGLTTAIAQTGDYPRLARHLSRLGGRSRAVLAEFVGHFTWTGDGELATAVIDEFITLKPAMSC